MDTKLKEFRNICENVSENEKIEMEKVFDEKLNIAIEKEISEYKNVLENKLENAKLEIEKEYYSQKIQYEIKAKRNLYLELENEKKEMFSELVAKLTNYCKTEDYSIRFEKIYTYTKKYLDDEINFIVYVVKDDIEKLKKIENCNIEILPDKYIGGILIKSNTKIIDNTIYTNLKERIYGAKENS